MADDGVTEWSSDDDHHDETVFFDFDKLTDPSWTGLVPWILHAFRISIKEALEKQGHNKLTVKNAHSEFHIFWAFTDSPLFLIHCKAGPYVTIIEVPPISDEDLVKNCQFRLEELTRTWFIGRKTWEPENQYTRDKGVLCEQALMNHLPRRHWSRHGVPRLAHAQITEWLLLSMPMVPKSGELASPYDTSEAARMMRNLYIQRYPNDWNHGHNPQPRLDLLDETMQGALFSWTPLKHAVHYNRFIPFCLALRALIHLREREGQIWHVLPWEIVESIVSALLRATMMGTLRIP